MWDKLRTWADDIIYVLATYFVLSLIVGLVDKLSHTGLSVESIFTLGSLLTIAHSDLKYLGHGRS